MASYECLMIRQVGDVTIAQLRSPKVDNRLVIDEIRKELATLVADKKPTRLLVNFRDVGFVSSQTINALVQTRSKLAAGGGTVDLCELADLVREAFTVLNLDGTLFRIFNTEKEALDALES